MLTQNDSSNDDFMRLEIPWIWSLELNFHWAISTGQTDNYDEHSKLFTFLKLWTQKFVTLKQNGLKDGNMQTFIQKNKGISARKFCPRSRYWAMNKGNRDIKSDKNDRWTWKMKTDQKIFQNFLPLPENQLLKIFFQKNFISSKNAPWNFRGVFGGQI